MEAGGGFIFLELIERSRPPRSKLSTGMPPVALISSSVALPGTGRGPLVLSRWIRAEPSRFVESFFRDPGTAGGFTSIKFSTFVLRVVWGTAPAQLFSTRNTPGRCVLSFPPQLVELGSTTWQPSDRWSPPSGYGPETWIRRSVIYRSGGTVWSVMVDPGGKR